uniref:Uncharacterized protein n=1 Tax=Geospiza parvula TaxID=87175 RepID=A0A8C3NFN6_GEOPR
SPVSPGATEDECLEFYGMLSLRRLFEVLAAQLTHGEAAVLSFLLDEAEGTREGTLLLELERRGLCHEGDLGQLRQLLRLLARHDLLRCVTLKRPRPGEWHLCHLCVTSLCVPFTLGSVWGQFGVNLGAFWGHFWGLRGHPAGDTWGSLWGILG